MKNFITFIAFLISLDAQSQSIGVGTATPNSSAILDVQSTNKGMLVPRMSSAIRTAILSPAQGLLVYDTDTNTFWYNNGVVWTNLANIVVGGWSLTGNGGTIPTTSFIGTTDNVPLRWRVNNTWAGELNPLTGNAFYGFKAGVANTSGINNTAAGANAFKSNITGSLNTATGDSALYSNTLGSENMANGANALLLNTTASRNIAIGNTALQSQSFTNGGVAWISDNVAIGYASLFLNQPNALDSGVGNTAIGNYAMRSNTRGSVNTANGLNTLFSNTSGSENTANGYSALQSNVTGSFNTGVGFIADVNDVNYTNSSAFGNLSLITASNQVRVGNSDVTSIGGYTGWTTLPSDSRFKKNVQANVPGLVFINKLRPVTYTLDVNGINNYMRRDMPGSGSANSKRFALTKENDPGMAAKEKIVFSGFIAQDVEKAAKEIGYDFSGIDAPKNNKDVYGLRYAEFVVPLVKAVQEQQQIISSQQQQIDYLTARLEKIEKLLEK